MPASGHSRLIGDVSVASALPLKMGISRKREKKHGITIETPMEARQAELGPSILLMLVTSVGIAVALGIVWFLFFLIRVALLSYSRSRLPPSHTIWRWHRSAL